MYHWDFGFLWTYRGVVAEGVVATVLYAAASVALGLAVGVGVGILRVAPRGWLKVPAALATAYLELFRCTPLLVQLIWMYYALPVLIGVELSPQAASVLTLSLYGGAFCAEIVRGGIVSIEQGQWDAARALGMRGVELMMLVVLPQAARRMTPPLVNQAIIMLKNTSLVSVVAVADLLYQGQVITSATYRPLEVYTAVAVIYFAILYPLTLAALRLEQRLARRD